MSGLRDDLEMVKGIGSPVSVSLKNVQWKYRGEGNGNMVLALENSGYVLRLVKVNAGHSPKSSWPVSSDSTIPDLPEEARASSGIALLHEDTSQLFRLVAYVRDTVAPLVGRTFVHHGDVVCVSGEDLRYLNSELRSQRPEFRKHRVLPESDCFALRMLDYCSRHILQNALPKARILGPILTVEIKPKMGFLRETMQKTADGQPAMTSSVCRYHLMQPWKLKMGKISAISDYCPLDLFSGCRTRVLKALKHLIRNPQNNLQIFQDGCLVFGERAKSSASEALQEFFQDGHLEELPERICQLLLEALLRQHPLDDVDIDLLPRKNQNVARRCGYMDFLSDWMEEGHHRDQQSGDDHSCEECSFQRGCILARLLNMQSISHLDASTLTVLYLRFKDQLDALPREKLQELLYGPLVQQSAPLAPDTFEYAINKIRNYLLSCTANDCSMMVTLGRLDTSEALPENDPWILRDVNAEGAAFAHSVALVDTDWKPHARIPNHARQEAEFVRHILETKAKNCS